jgi:uncharacterized phage-associated protein
MEKNSTTKIYFPNVMQQTDTSATVSVSYAFGQNSRYSKLSLDVDSKPRVHTESANRLSATNVYVDSTIERVAQWFLSLASMSNKKLQKLCYYAYCWFIVFNNDLESINEHGTADIRVLCSDRFQAWIHGPVCPRLYHRYKGYGWHDIPQATSKPKISTELESLLEQVWEAYGDFTAYELERISHGEEPWKNARKGYQNGDACSNEISDYDILRYYSNLE